MRLSVFLMCSIAWVVSVATPLFADEKKGRASEGHAGAATTGEKTRLGSTSKKSHDFSPESSFSVRSYDGGVANLIEAELKKAGYDVLVDMESITRRPIVALLDYPYREFTAKDNKTGKTLTGKILVKTFEGSVPCDCGKEAMPHYRKAYMAAWDNKAVPVGGAVLEVKDNDGAVIHTRKTCELCK